MYALTQMKFTQPMCLLLLVGALSGCISNDAANAVVSHTDTNSISAEQHRAVIHKPAPLKPVEQMEEVTKSPEQIDDVWQRIRMQLRFADSDDKRVRSRMQWYLKQPHYMEVISERAGPFLYYLVTEVEKRNLPIELALMPMIESDFDTQAYSHKHASGLWQLTPYIAKYFGAHINDWYDGRQDIVDATEASLDFLEYLYKRFDGNWYHAIAAYNTGEGRVLRAIKRNKAANRSTDFFSLTLPKETRHFVPKLLAVTQILRHRLMDFPVIANQPVISVLPLEKHTILPDSHLWPELDKLNPGYARFPALLQGGGHIVVPTKRQQEWQTMMLNLPEPAADTWLQYRIRSGDTLSEIAARFALSVKQLKNFNQLDSNRIFAGQSLILPMLAEQQLEYKIQSGDSLWHIARRFGLSVAKIKQWNGLSSDTLQIGKTLNLFLDRS